MEHPILSEWLSLASKRSGYWHWAVKKENKLLSQKSKWVLRWHEGVGTLEHLLCARYFSQIISNLIKIMITLSILFTKVLSFSKSHSARSIWLALSLHILKHHTASLCRCHISFLLKTLTLYFSKMQKCHKCDNGQAWNTPDYSWMEWFLCLTTLGLCCLRGI